MKHTESDSLFNKEEHLILFPNQQDSYMTCSSDLKMVAIAKDFSIRIIDPHCERSYPDLVGHKDLIYDIKFSSDDTLLASGSGDKTLRIWNPYTGQQIDEFLHDDYVYEVRFSPDGVWIASSSGGVIRLWNLSSREYKLLNSHTGFLCYIQYFPEGRLLISIANAYLLLWDTKRSKQLMQILTKLSNWSVNVGKKIIASPGKDNRIRIYSNHKQLRCFQSQSPDECQILCFSANGQKLATGSHNQIEYWDIQKGNSKALIGHTEFIQYLCFSKDGKYLISGANDSIRVQLC